MALVYSTYEAKAKFSEILRMVRAGRKVVISYRGEEVAEIRPIERESGGLDARLERLEERGALVPAKSAQAKLTPLLRRPGALQRFLDERE